MTTTTRGASGLLQPRPTHTHRITIPGTRFVAHVRGEDAAFKLAKKLAKTRIAPRKRAQPIIEELAALAAGTAEEQ